MSVLPSFAMSYGAITSGRVVLAVMEASARTVGGITVRTMGITDCQSVPPRRPHLSTLTIK